MSSPVDNPKYYHNAEAWWKVTIFDRVTYHECETQAPNEHYANMFVTSNLMHDGIPLHHMTLISIERIDGPSEDS